MRLDAPRKKMHEPDLTGLINIVFLILIFFIVAGSLRPYSARDIELSKAPNQTQSAAPRSSLVVQADGQILYHGGTVPFEELKATLESVGRDETGRPFVIVADKRADAARLLDIVAIAKSAGATNIAILTERANGQ